MAKTKRVRAVATSNGGRMRAELRDALAMVAALAAAAALLAPVGQARAAMYKWVDEKGVVHYTDKLPPEAVDKASVELNKQGVPIKKTDKALTPEQRRALEQEAENKKQTARQQEEVARRDRALLSSYSNEAEIDLARNRSLQTINNVVQSTLAFTRAAEQAQGRGRSEEGGVPGQAPRGRAGPRAREHRRRARAPVRPHRAKEARDGNGRREIRRRQAALARARRGQGRCPSPESRRAPPLRPPGLPPRTRRDRACMPEGGRRAALRVFGPSPCPRTSDAGESSRGLR